MLCGFLQLFFGHIVAEGIVFHGLVYVVQNKNQRKFIY